MTILTRKALEAMLTAQLRGGELIAPAEIDGRAYFRAFRGEGSLSGLLWPAAPGEGQGRGRGPGQGGGPLTVNTLKEFFFPRRQELYVQRPEGITPAGSLPGGPRLVAFARPCDTRALGILDQVFLGPARDAAYGALREATTIVGLECLQPDERCFCTSVGGGPSDTEGMDVSLRQLDGGSFAARAVSARGEAFLAGGGTEREQGRAAEADAGAEARRGARARAEGQAGEPTGGRSEAAVSRVMRLPDPRALDERFDSEYWREVSRSCLACGICSYLCPTCHCFDIVDEGYLRLRCWDTCSAATFTRTAAGEDHHRHKHTRYRQRVYHKFSWFKDNHGTVSCVGCGRCTRYCPVKIDIVEVINGIGGIGGIGAGGR